MEISVIGAGYVGITLGVSLASKGHKVTWADKDREVLEKLAEGKSPIHEEGIQELLEDSDTRKNMESSINTEKAVENSKITIITVGTPTQEDGSIDLKNIKSATQAAARGLRDEYHLFVVKSTVTPKTTSEELIPIIQEESGQEPGKDFGICMNPEFLSQGSALDDFLEPDRIVIGEYDEKSGEKLGELYSDFEAPVVRTDLRTAELVKYASNALLATKISFINEIGNLCKELEIDVYEVAKAVAKDERINREFLDSGVGFGGSCLPKDITALATFMDEKNVEPSILRSVTDVNTQQKKRAVKLLEERLGTFIDKKIAVLGLSFKPGTDDVRNSPAIEIIEQLKRRDADVHAYDPQAMKNMEEHHPNIRYLDTYQEALEDADGAILVTDWPEFDGITRAELKSMKNPVLIEGRRTEHDISENLTEGITWP